MVPDSYNHIEHNPYLLNIDCHFPSGLISYREERKIKFY